MIIAEAAASQEIKFIARTQCVTGSAVIFDKQQNTSTNFTGITFVKDRHYQTMTLDLSALKNERKYLLVVSGTPRETFRGILFLTAQDPDTYSINDGLYNEPTSTNEYLVAE